MLGSDGPVAVHAVVEELQEALIAAVAHVVDKPPVASFKVGGPQDVEVRGVFHQAVGVSGRKLQVRDGGIGGVVGVDGELDSAFNGLVGANIARDHAVGEGFWGMDVQPDLGSHFSSFRRRRYYKSLQRHSVRHAESAADEEPEIPRLDSSALHSSE